MEPVKILFVEENEITRFYFRDSFWLHGQQDSYDICFADCIEKAVETLKEPGTKLDVIFLDLLMHVKKGNRMVLNPEGGLDLIKKIRAIPGMKNTKIVIFSSPEYFKIWPKAKKLGANYFVKKDQFLPNHLVAWVDQMLEKQ